jgi:integrase/recombinase XerD
MGTNGTWLGGGWADHCVGPRRTVGDLSAHTGLRRLEAASLTPASFSLKEEGVSTVEVQAAYTKNRLKAVLPLPPSLVPLLRAYLRGLPADRPVWPLKPTSMTQHMVQKDMAEAGMDVKVGNTSYDFHSLRGQYATRLANAGVPLVKAAALLRHSDPRLTMAVYTHLTTEDLGKEVEKLG